MAFSVYGTMRCHAFHQYEPTAANIVEDNVRHLAMAIDNNAEFAKGRVVKETNFISGIADVDQFRSRRMRRCKPLDDVTDKLAVRARTERNHSFAANLNRYQAPVSFRRVAGRQAWLERHEVPYRIVPTKRAVGTQQFERLRANAAARLPPIPRPTANSLRLLGGRKEVDRDDRQPTSCLVCKTSVVFNPQVEETARVNQSDPSRFLIARVILSIFREPG